MDDRQATLTINGTPPLEAAHVDALRALLKGEVRAGVHDRLLYATDASIYQTAPTGVVVPQDVRDLVRAVGYAAQHNLPILPRGGGTSLAGQAVARALIIDASSGCRALLSQDETARTCEVEPGITIADLNRTLAARGSALYFAPDPSTVRQATVGGCIGNNAAGTRSILYGRTSENVLEISAVLPSGLGCEPNAKPLRFKQSAATADPRTAPLAQGVLDIIRRNETLIRERFPKTLRRNAGYALDSVLTSLDAGIARGLSPLDAIDLSRLICGSEGTLAVVTGATLALHPTPRRRGLAVLGFSELDDAIASVVPLLQFGPSAVELLDDLVVGLARLNTEYRRYVDLMPQPRTGELKAILYVEFSELPDGETIEASFERLKHAVGGLPGNPTCAYLANPTEVGQALKLRQAGEPLLHAIPGARKPLGFIEDNAVPPERLSEFVTGLRAILDREGTRGAFYAHASVGVLHVRPLLDPRDTQDLARMERIAIETADLAQSLGGVMSGEHGDGKARGPLLERYFGPELMRAFQEVKDLFDPKGLLNPGNIVTPGSTASIGQSLRVQAGHLNAKVSTAFNYDAEGGFDHAVELCNGAGVCRKTAEGTMCPSYRGTLDERHSTRGRGNALRLAITGQLNTTGEPAWNDPETLETLNLCLSCKACKTECPSNVDIAQYKAEYLWQSYKAAGKTPLRARAFGAVRLLNRIGSATLPLSNLVLNSAPHRAIINRALGLAPQRKLPAFARSLFRQSRSIHINEGLPADAPAVVLYADCFTTYNEPEIGLATATLLNAFGYRVEIPRVGCCGRAQLSTGLLDQAATSINQTLTTLRPYMQRDTPPVAIVACEPSCLSALTDEWQKLALLDPSSKPLRQSIAAIATSPEAFLDAEWDNHPKRPAFSLPKGRAVVHGHCHQKALWGIGTTTRVLRRILGDTQVLELDTGCCGMAGSFGYTSDRFELSQTIADMDLFAKLGQTLENDDTLIAPGTSCRHQVLDGVRHRKLAHTEPMHPMLYLSGILKH